MVRQKSFVRALLAVFMCICTVIAVFPVSASAATAIKWDGRTKLLPGKVYVVTDSYYIRDELVIPQGTKLSVREGGELKIPAGGAVRVFGELAIAIGGLVKNSGTLNVKPGAVMNVYGTVQSTLNGIFDISGDVTVFNKGKLETSSAMRIYKSAYILDKGIMSFYKSSDVKMSGTILTTQSSTLELRGICSVTLSGNISVNGHLTIGALSAVKCSGRITLGETASYTRFASVAVTKSGKFMDERPEYEYEDMTVDILIDEPDVKLRGIDVSYAQGDIDWEQVAKSGLDFVIIRAGRGRAGKDNTMKEDDYFRKNMEGAKKYGIDVGVYFYSYATSVSEAAEEARFFVDIIKGYQIQYPVILDMEETFQGNIGKKKLTNMINAFFEVLMENNYFPMFYSYKAWIEQFLDMTVLDKYALWLAQVNDTVTYDGGYYIWQYSFTGKVSGIKGTVDLDISYKDWPSILRKYGLNNLTNQ